MLMLAKKQTSPLSVCQVHVDRLQHYY